MFIHRLAALTIVIGAIATSDARTGVNLAMGHPRGMVNRPATVHGVSNPSPGHTPQAARASTDAAALYKAHCATCHDATGSRAPDRATLSLKTREAILASLVSGTMSVVVKALSGPDKRAIAAFLGRAADRALAGDIGLCPSSASPSVDAFTGPRWIGWGADLANTRFQPPQDAGISPEDVPRLNLKWAFGFPDATQAYAQPTITGGRVFVGSQKGTVYALDAATGCAHWSFTAGAGVRTAVSAGRVSLAGGSRAAVFFGDVAANAYALDADTGEKLWQTRVDDHPAARVTGTPVVYESRLYVPVSSIEEASAGTATYECCRFRGSVVALDAATGTTAWKTFTIAGEPEPTRKSAAGTQLWAPAGASVWSAPTIDVKRRVLYVGTGNAYSEPAADTVDAILALDLATGQIRWARQMTSNDVFVMGCQGANANCPEKVGPDFDFGVSPVLRSLSSGRDILVVGQKSGVAYGLDPDREGAVVWQFRAGQGGPLGGIEWGIAADTEHVYVPVSDVLRPAAEAGGLFALRLADGAKVWHAPAPVPSCTSGRGCTGAQSAAISAIAGVVFSGSIDGHLRAYSSKDGRILWDYDTARDFDTVNQVKATGGSIDAAGPVIAGGLVLTNSGYGAWRGRPGNVLLAFAVEAAPARGRGAGRGVTPDPRMPR